MNNFESVIEEFKKEEGPNDVFLLIDYSGLRTVCSLWSKVQITHIGNDKGKPPSKPNEKWNWLWDRINYDMDMLIEATGLSVDVVTDILDRLKAARIIYPDNAIHKFADSYLQGVIASSFNELRKSKFRVKGEK